MQTQKKVVSAPITLTLKNLYRVLTQKDYPIPTYDVFSRNMLKGQTLLVFWHSFFQEAFPASVDLSFFIVDGRHNRSLSRLLNRTSSSNLMKSWFDHLSKQLTTSLLLKIIRTWMKRLTEMDYDPSALNHRLTAFLRAVIDSDGTLSDDERSFLQKLADSLSKLDLSPSDCQSQAFSSQQNKSSQSFPPVFLHSVVLSWLTLFALYGSQAHDTPLTFLRLNPNHSPDALYRSFLASDSSDNKQIILSSQGSVILSPPLPADAYVGHTVTLQSAVKRLSTSGRLAVTGIGGSGKTEFVRQLLQAVKHQYDSLAFVQYQDNLTGSFLLSFPQLGQASPDDLPAQVYRFLENPSHGKTLLIIDNITHGPQQDTVLNSLTSCPCDVILTSRLPPPEGFSEIHLSGLDLLSSRKLFLIHDPSASDQTGDIDRLCGMVSGHPLAIEVFAKLCRVRFRQVRWLTETLQKEGLHRLSYIELAQPVRLSETFSRLFSQDSLTDQQRRLMALYAILPFQYWIPSALIPYALDVCPDEDDLADQSQILCDLGLLLRSDAGYAIHPLIAETVRLRNISADDYPRLWEAVSSISDSMDTSLQLILISLVQHTSQLNPLAVRCLSYMEQRLGSFRYYTVPEDLYRIHRNYLDSTAQAYAGAETDYWLALGIRDIVVHSTISHLTEYFQHMEMTGEAIYESHRLTCLYTLLERAASLPESGEVKEYFDVLRPENASGIEMANYLISLSVYLRNGAKDPEGAIAALMEARKILSGFPGEASSLRTANLSYRYAMCLLDLDRKAEAAHELEQCLEIYKKYGYPDDSPMMMATRSTFAVSLYLMQDYPHALQVFSTLDRLYKEQDRTHSTEYVMMRNNTALALFESGAASEAEKTILDVIRLDEDLPLQPHILASHQRNAALILARNGKFRKALPLARKAVENRMSLFGPDSPWTGDANAVMALVLSGLGQDQQSRELIDASVALLISSWGQDHRHTRNALRIQNEIRQKAASSDLPDTEGQD